MEGVLEEKKGALRSESDNYFETKFKSHILGRRGHVELNQDSVVRDTSIGANSSSKL